MADICIPRDKLPRVTVGDNGWLSCDDVSFSPATSIKLARLWALRYLAVAEYLETQQEKAAANSDTDYALVAASETLFSRPLSKLTRREREAATTFVELQEKAGEVPTPEPVPEPSGMVDTSKANPEP